MTRSTNQIFQPQPGNPRIEVILAFTDIVDRVPGGQNLERYAAVLREHGVELNCGRYMTAYQLAACLPEAIADKATASLLALLAHFHALAKATEPGDPLFDILIDLFPDAKTRN